MHEYYSKNRDKLKKTMEGYLAPIKSEIEKETGKAWDMILPEIWECYEKDMLEHFPYIGGDKASGTGNLTGAYMFVALGVVMKRYGVSLERWGYLSTEAYKKVFEKIPSFVKKAVPHLLNHPKFVLKMLEKKDEKNRKNSAENPGSFVTKAHEGTPDRPIIYDTLVCPLSNFAKEYGYEEFMPYICNLDYVMFESLGVPFYREKTCSSGDGCCDFSFRPGGPIIPSWPCHVLDGSDNLK